MPTAAADCSGSRPAYLQNDLFGEFADHVGHLVVGVGRQLEQRVPHLPVDAPERQAHVGRHACTEQTQKRGGQLTQ